MDEIEAYLIGLMCGRGHIFRKDKRIIIEFAHKNKVIEGIAHCEKCGHNRIINWNHYSTQGENEIVLLFHRCVKCGNTWREVGN